MAFALGSRLVSRSGRQTLKPHFARQLSPSRFSSQGPNRGNGRWHLLDRTSTTYLGVTVGALLGGYYVTHLEKVPETGRRRFMAVSVEQEDYIHKLMVEETLQDFRGRLLPSNHPLSQQVRRITRRIITSSNLGHLQGELAPEPVEMMDPFPAAIPRPQTLHPDREWVVLVINDRSLVNAFAAPGLVCVSTGIMPVARNEEGLAAIIGHEIGHVVMRHTSEHLSQAKLFLPIIGLLVMLGLGPFVSALMMRYFYVLPHSRALETEADLMGIKLMARACYDPGAAPRRGRVFEAFKRLEAVNTFKFLDTHPPTEERIAHLKTLLPASFEIYNSNPECSQLDEMRRRGHLSRVRMNIDC